MMFSVIVATYNRMASLRAVLEALAAQQTGGRLTYEVIVTDNGSTDATESMVSALSRAYPVRLRYVRETRRGKPHALNAALALAAGDFIAFTDDDTVIPDRWLAALHEACRRHQADGAGGPVRPVWITPRPAWLTDGLLRQLGMVEYGAAPFVITSPEQILIGPNCAYRKALFTRLGGFQPGDPAEDTDWFLRALRAGARLVYEPAAALGHQIDGDRLTPKSLARRLFRHGQGYGLRLQEQRNRRTVCRVPLWVVRTHLGLHAKALAALALGESGRAREHWLMRHVYAGVMQQCAADWLRRKPANGARPAVQ